MCFRPADASASSAMSKCPECGKPLPVTGGMVLKACPFCKCDLSPHLSGAKAPVNQPPATPGAPAAPGAPKAPGVSK